MNDFKYNEHYQNVEYAFSRAMRGFDIDPIFDLTIYNYNNDSIIISEIGVKIGKFASLRIGRGGNEAYFLKIKKSNCFDLEVGDLLDDFNKLSELEYNIFSFDINESIQFEEIIEIKKGIIKKLDLKDPLVIPSKSESRLFIRLKNFKSYHHTILNIYFKSNNKIINSENILLDI